MDMMNEINWQLILMIAATSAVVSYVGDILGMKLGKKRITFGRLRPRHTSTVITVITGVVVAVITLLVASYTSGQVRHAFFGVNYLDRQISQLTVDLRDRQYQLDETEIEVFEAKQQLERLRAESEELRKGLDEMKGGRVVVFGGELLSQTTIEGGASQQEIDAAVDRLIDGAEVHLRGDGDTQAETRSGAEVVVTDDVKRALAEELRGEEGRKVLRLSAPSNTVGGQRVEGAIDVYDSRLIYNEGDVITMQRIEEITTQQGAIDLLYLLLRRTNRAAISAGVLQDDFSGKVGRMDSMEFYEVADNIATGSGARVVEIRAARDIYTEGPVDVRVEISPAQ